MTGACPAPSMHSARLWASWSSWGGPRVLVQGTGSSREPLLGPQLARTELGGWRPLLRRHTVACLVIKRTQASLRG